MIPADVFRVRTMCVGMSDPGMVVLPTHRLFRGLNSVSSNVLVSALNGYFDVEQLGAGLDLAHEAWSRIESSGDQENLAYGGAD